MVVAYSFVLKILRLGCIMKSLTVTNTGSLIDVLQVASKVCFSITLMFECSWRLQLSLILTPDY